MSKVTRIYTFKKPGFDVEAAGMTADLKENLGIKGLKSVCIVNIYDVAGISDQLLADSLYTIFAERPVDNAYIEEFEFPTSARVFAVEFLPGQYDQRADSAAQCLQILTGGDKPEVRSSKCFILEGDITDAEFDDIKNYCINPIESREAGLKKPETLEASITIPDNIPTINRFTVMSDDELCDLWEELSLAMSKEDLRFVRDYFKNEEKRDPTYTEIKVIDTYWSDHCRHTTFLTSLKNVEIEEGELAPPVKAAWNHYIEGRQYVYGNKAGNKDVCLMDIATIAAKQLKKEGRLQGLDESDENNACSIEVEVLVDYGKSNAAVSDSADSVTKDTCDNGSKTTDCNNCGVQKEKWLVMFKNETHNHPTEIEPFGGAATCLGGAIRDPLSGRSYVYQAMRVTGSGDPRAAVSDTIPGKLPQRKITTVAAEGYSSYGNQIGLATGLVDELYHEGYVAKRMEIGAVIGAAPKSSVVRSTPEPGDIIILLGGRTGRDGCGGATGSSKAHTIDSLTECGAEVQKGNPPTERKIQRLFRKSEVTRLIKKCNDFGAGGVSVAIGELADGLLIDLDSVPKKYEGLDGTELAISESQERMAVVVSPKNKDKFIYEARKENLEATVVAEVTAEPYLRMVWRGNTIVNISRSFLNTNGVRQEAVAHIKLPGSKDLPFGKIPAALQDSATTSDIKSSDSGTLSLKEAWVANLKRLECCSRQGLSERFDSTVGASSILMPFGGEYQLTPSEGMASKIPVENGDSLTSTLMTYGFDPHLSEISPFHGALYAVVQSVSRIIAMGGDYKKVWFTFQEYYEKLGKDPLRWGKPLSALLGAYLAQREFGRAAIGGKDSMSGSFMDLDVPPTLVSFAVAVTDVDKVLSSEFKQPGSTALLFSCRKDKYGLPDFNRLKNAYSYITNLNEKGLILSAISVKAGGIGEAVSKMCFGNMLGFTFEKDILPETLFSPDYGNIILEVSADALEKIQEELESYDMELLGYTTTEKEIIINGISMDLDYLQRSWSEVLEGVFPSKAEEGKCVYTSVIPNSESEPAQPFRTASAYIMKGVRPKVLIPVFPGTNCEYDSAKAFMKAGAEADTFVIRNLNHEDIKLSMKGLAEKIRKSNIIMIPGGFSAGDEPEGSGKFISIVFRNPLVSEAVMDLLENRDGLILGICNGFQALIKLGLLPWGQIREIRENDPTLTFNTIGRHVSRMVRTRIMTNNSPWLMKVMPGDIHIVPVSHGEGRFHADKDTLEALRKNGQVATCYVDMDGNPTMDPAHNPNGSVAAIEGIISPDGRIFGKMGHSERIGNRIGFNVPGLKDQKIFESGVAYFTR